MRWILVRYRLGEWAMRGFAGGSMEASLFGLSGLAAEFTNTDDVDKWPPRNERGL